MIKLTILPFALAATIALPHSAVAADLVATYSGFITGENAADTVFGGNAAVGDSITASFYYSTSVPGTRATVPDNSDEVSGGLAFGTGSVISKAVFTSGNYSFSFTPDYYTDVYASAGFLDAYAYGTDGRSSQTFILPDSRAPANLEAAFSSTGVGDMGGSTTQYSYVTDGGTTVDFNASRIVVSAAPEPGTWLLMLGGVGMVGLMLHRRRRDAVIA